MRNTRTGFGSRWLGVALGALAALVLASAAQAAPIYVVDDGTPNHIALPPGDYAGTSGAFEGFDADSAWLDIELRLRSNGSVETPGGALGGHVQTWTGAVLELTLFGGSFPYYRTLSLPVQVVTHSAPRSGPVPGVGQLVVAQQLRFLSAELTGDPDFDLLRITAGYDLGMPSPGQTTLEIPYDVVTEYWVDGFFDVDHAIEIVGAAGGPFAGWNSISEVVSTWELVGSGVPEPPLAALVGAAAAGVALARRRRSA
jgi:hypothetical protein